MSDKPEWKQSLHKAMQEPHAIGWIGLFVLVIVDWGRRAVFHQPPFALGRAGFSVEPRHPLGPRLDLG